MVRHSLLYLLAKDETQPQLEEWPEIGTVEFATSDECYLNNFCMGGPFEASSKIISLQVDDDYGLRYITECLKGVHVVALRGSSFDREWGDRLETACKEGNTIISQFDRHGIVAALGCKSFWDGIALLQDAVGHLRGPAVQASPEAMRTETVLTRAIEALSTTQYRTPRR
jgi:hypothetical protein